MLAIQKSKAHQGKCTANILPCRINHNGPVDTSKRYWNPSVRDGKTVAYFRGRKLHGRSVKVPKGYKGVVMQRTEKPLPTVQVEEEDEKEDEVKVFEEVGIWNKLMVWGHEVEMDEADPYVRGVEEWLELSGAIHAFDRPRGKGEGENDISG